MLLKLENIFITIVVNTPGDDIDIPSYAGYDVQSTENRLYKFTCVRINTERLIQKIMTIHMGYEVHRLPSPLDTYLLQNKEAIQAFPVRFLTDTELPNGLSDEDIHLTRIFVQRHKCDKHELTLMQLVRQALDTFDHPPTTLRGEMLRVDENTLAACAQLVKDHIITLSAAYIELLRLYGLDVSTLDPSIDVSSNSVLA
jgi:hypothetical protein